MLQASIQGTAIVSLSLSPPGCVITVNWGHAYLESPSEGLGEWLSDRRPCLSMRRILGSRLKHYKVRLSDLWETLACRHAKATEGTL